jgi:general stress protein 26
MTAQVDRQDRDKEDGGPIYFFASKTDGVGRDVRQGGASAIATFTSKSHKIFADIHGTLLPSDDRAVIDRLWGPIIASWYKDGKDDPDLLLLRFDTVGAEIWEADAGATLKAAALKALFDIDPGKEHQADNKAEVRL